MKKVNDKELNQITGGYADRYFWQETLINKDEEKEKDTNEIVVTENEDGTVTVSGGW